MDLEVIKPQAAQHSDAFTLLGFASWEDVDNEKLAAAATDILEFTIHKENKEIGFHANQK